MTRRFALSVAVVVAQATCLLLAPTAAWADDRCMSGPAPKSSPALAGACAVLAAVNARDIATLARLMADDFALTAVTGNYFPESPIARVSRSAVTATARS